MKALFNGECDGCMLHRPRCAIVYLRIKGTARGYDKNPCVLCDVCRKTQEFRGRFKAEGRHR